MTSMPTTWRFAIDVGGTFTDVLAQGPTGAERVMKVLSNGRIRGVAGMGSTARAVVDAQRASRRADLWAGYRACRLGDDAATARVIASDPDGTLHLDAPLPRPFGPGARYELSSGEPAPIVAIRGLMELRLDEPIGPVDVRLGSTWGTNALLERRGAATVLAITAGFGDLLAIGYQDRPQLFALNIRKSAPLYERVIEIAERISATGEVLRAPDASAIDAQLRAARDAGMRSLAICLMHACVNDAHERLVAQVAESIGFEHLSVSSQVAPAPRIVPRGDTTVVDAYLSPVIRTYVERLRRCLPHARLRLMTSAGGLVSAESFTAKDSVLSGPAGGVVGCAAIAREAGFARAIGFDMGGTSTDVCRCDGAFDYQYETEKAGVRIVAPMLAVETVAAGGGSICGFDGQKLVVGPRSAGADPGPACYGRGGPLALTDVNLFLGRIQAEHFPFPLDRRVVEQRLAALAADIGARGAKALTPIELAEGFVAIANANMAAAIKKVSVARGYDVREYALVAFGGAGGQHACGVARLLGMCTALIGPHAGVLSALGMARADVTRHAEQPILARDAAARQHVPSAVAALEARLRSEMQAEGFYAEQLEVVRMLDLRYVGQNATLGIRGDEGVDLRSAFEAAHQRAYGFHQAGREIEIVTARVELIGRTDAPPRARRPLQTRQPPVETRHDVVFDGVARSTPVYFRERLDAGDNIDGPAVVVDSFGTIVVEPGWTVRVTDRLDLVLDAAGAPGVARASGRSLARESGESTRPNDKAVWPCHPPDPIRLELFHRAFASIAEQMGAMLRRTAVSTNVKERLDFSCAVFDAEGALAANAPHIPVHLGGMGACVRRMIEIFGPLAPGDVVITNDPFEGGSHLPDVTVVTPVHVAGEPAPRFFVASRAHHAEIGGKRPGSMAADATSLAEEGVLISPFKLIDAGREQFGALRKLLVEAHFPSRQPDENLADVAAQVAANRRGVQLLEELAAENGADVVSGYMRHIRAASAKQVQAALRRLRAGVYRRCETLDDGTPIAVTITVAPERAVFDFTGSGPVHPGNLNANPSIVVSAVLYCLRCLIDEDVPLNGGVLEPIELIIPPGFLNPAGAGAAPSAYPAVGGGNVETSQRIVDAIFGALGVVAASQGTMNNVLIGTPQFGYYETIAGGAGAGPDFDGADAVHTHMTNTRLTDPEVFESRYPLRLIRFAIRRGSGGAGRRRGGDGIVRRIEFLAPAEVSILSQRRSTQPYGLAGGAPGASGRNQLYRADGELHELGALAHFTAQAGDQIQIETPGGGGYGPAESEANR